MSKTPTSKSSGQKTPTSKLAPAKTPNSTSSKPSSRNGLLPPMTTAKYNIDVEVLKCPACSDVFKSPRVLPCGHSLCLECLYSSIVYSDFTKSKDYFQCVVCRKNVKPRDPSSLREKWATQYPVNSVIVRVLRNVTVKNTYDDGWHKAFCEICLMNNSTKTAVSYCNSCLEHHCVTCAKHHEKREETREHEIVSFFPKDDAASEKRETTRADLAKKGKHGDDHVERRVKIFDPATKEMRLTPLPQTVVSQTVTASDTMREKHIIRLGIFNGKAKGDIDLSDFKGATFLTDFRLMLVDGANRKLKVFDISHKSRVELMSEMTLRTDPTHACRVDANTVAVLTERSGTYHVRLFTIRDKIYNFVHRIIEGVPLGIGFIQNTVICSFLAENALRKYRLSRAQQALLGTIKEDRTGNDIFHHPGAICTGKWKETQVIFVADETEYGVTVIAIDTKGERKTNVFFEFPVPKPKSPAKKTNGSGVPKTGRSTRARSTSRKDDASDTTNESELPSERATGKQPTKRQAAEQQRKEVRLSGRHTFRRVDNYGRPETERAKGREIERTPMTSIAQADLLLNLEKLTQDDDESGSLDKTLPLRSRRNGKAVERARKRPVGKVAPQSNGGTNTQRENGEKLANTHNGTIPNLNATFTADMSATLNATVGPNSTGSTSTLQAPPKLVYRADSLAVDNDSNIYMCISSMNKIHQMSPDGRVKRDLFTDKDGLVAPRLVTFSPSNDVIVVTCKKSNKVHMFKLK